LKEKSQTREEVVSQLAHRIDGFEKYPLGHSSTMAALACELAARLGLSKIDIEAIEEAALLHDIGLHAMAPSYYSSGDPLSFEERIDLWRHPVIGEQQMAKHGCSRHAQLLVRWHHEWWNGTGYPDMLAYEDIPIGARIIRAVDLHGALTSDRPYRNRLSEEAALTELAESAGVECDPYIVEVLLALLSEKAETAAESRQEPIPYPGQLETEPSSSTIENGTQPKEESEGGAATEPSGLDAHWTAEEVGSRAGVADSYLPEPPARAPAEAPSIIATFAPAPPSDRVKSRQWLDWKSGRYSRKSLLGFEASVLRQIEFKSVAIPFCGRARLEWYLSAWGKQILSNDNRAWAAALSRAVIGAGEPLGEEVVSRLLEDAYVPAARLGNPGLRRWFGEADAWFLDNLRRNIDAISDEEQRAEALAIGLLTGDYALSFDERTAELKRPLNSVFRAFANRSYVMLRGRARGRINTYNLPALDFIRRARSDLLYLDVPVAQVEIAGSEARSEWRDCWVTRGETIEAQENPQSKKAYLESIDQLLRSASHIKTWALAIQETGLTSARDLSDLIKEHRQAHTTYSKDLTEVAGGFRNYIVVATAG